MHQFVGIRNGKSRRIGPFERIKAGEGNKTHPTYEQNGIEKSSRHLLALCSRHHLKGPLFEKHLKS